MLLVTLTSDWNNNDYYAGSLKGKIISKVPKASIIDLNHNIPTFRLAQAAFIIRNSFYNFPEGTIHLICINTEHSVKNKYLIVEYEGHFFISADNGIIGLICNDIDKIKQVKEFNGNIDNKSFDILDVYPECVKAIYENKLSNITTDTREFEKHVPMRPVFDENIISGSVIYIDSYRNIITNINRKIFDDVGKGRKYEILVQSNHYRITKINQSYGETPVGELLALFNSLSLLEIAIRDGNVADLLNISINAVIRIKFLNN